MRDEHLHQCGAVVHLRLAEGVSHFFVFDSFHKNPPLVLSRIALFLLLYSPLLFAAFLLLSLNSSGIHTEKSILPGLFADGIYINIHMRLF